MDMRECLVTAVDRLIASGEIEKQIEKALASTVATAIEHELRSYSDFGKSLTEKVQAAFALNGSLDLPSYNDALLKIIHAQVEHQTRDTIQRQVAERMKELLTPPPESISLTKLVEQYIEHVKEHVEGGCVCYGEEQSITLIVEESSTKGFHHVYLDDEPNKKRDSCDINIGLHRDEVYHLSFRNQAVEKQMFAGPFYGFERMLFQMKAAKSKLVLDATADELDLSYASDHD